MCIVWLKKLLGKTNSEELPESGTTAAGSGSGSSKNASQNYQEGTEGTMFLIIGLGNPGTKYAGTRHNIGWDAVTAIADATGISLNTKECKGITGTGVIDGVKVKLVQPQTFMNNSGECVRALMDFYKVPAEDVLIICDEVSLPTGRLRIRTKGSAGGHNGMKSIIAHIGTSDFARLRIGVGEKPEGWDLADHVLAHFPKEEEPEVREALKNAVAATRCILSDGVEAAMNRYNGK